MKKQSLSILSIILLAFPMVALSYQTASIKPKEDATKIQQVAPDYVLGPGDVIDVAVTNHIELSGEFLIPLGGNVVLPEIGKTHVEGLTILQATLLLRDKLNEVLMQPRVTVVLKSKRVTQVSVLGDVQHPEVVPLLSDLHLADVISQAGGLLPTIKASECIVTVTHRDGSKGTIEMSDLLSGVVGSNPLIQDGDSVLVDAGLLTVYVVGQVRTSGNEQVRRGSNLLEAIASAGGPTDGAALTQVKLTHKDGTESTINLLPAMYRGDSRNLPKLAAGDLINVPLSDARYAVLGHVKNPGVFPMPEGRVITLAEAMGEAKGDDNGRLGRVSVARYVNGKPTQKIYNFAKYLGSADPSQNPIILPGDVVFVPESNHISATLAIGALSAAALLYEVTK